MKKELFLWTGLISGMIFALWERIIFKQTQQINYYLREEELKFLQKQAHSLKEDLIFLTAHEKESTFLEKKGWFVPKNRLMGADILERLQGTVNKINYTFEPETIKSLNEGHTFKVTRMILDIKALVDTDVYVFMKQLIENFSGILVLREIALTREEEINEKSLLALKQKENPNFISGRLIFDWVALGDTNNEK